MYDLLSNLNGWGLILFTAVAGGLVLLLVSSVTAIVGGHLLKIRELDNCTRLKQDMLDGGMSADEIKTVLEAGMKK
jgi:UPF0716 family protein affecting phage T7 exclusion